VAGGGGGSGGSCVAASPVAIPLITLQARVIQRGTNVNTSIVQAQGGAGGNGGVPAGGNCGGGGGGGGAGAGVIYVVTDALLGSSIANALDVTGGNGGGGGNNTGTGTAGDGGYSGGGGVVEVYDCGRGVATRVAAVAPVANVGQAGGVATVSQGAL
jgi:hypothetical protein